VDRIALSPLRGDDGAVAARGVRISCGSCERAISEAGVAALEIDEAFNVGEGLIARTAARIAMAQELTIPILLFSVSPRVWRRFRCSG